MHSISSRMRVGDCSQRCDLTRISRHAASAFRAYGMLLFSIFCAICNILNRSEAGGSMTAAVWKTDEEPLVKRNRSIGGLMADSGLIYVIFVLHGIYVCVLFPIFGKTFLIYISFMARLVLFFIAFIVPCRAAVPELRRINDRYEGRINMIGVSLDTDDGKWQSALDSLMSWRQFRVRKEDAGPVSLEYGITAIPAYFVISASGEILGRCSDVAELSRMLGKIIND